MSDKPKIKVIKKAELRRRRAANRDRKESSRDKKEVVNTVSTWVAEFKERKREETKKAIDQLLTSPQASNA